MPPRPRPGILEIQAYVGGDASAPGVDRVIRLASNENPLGPSPKAEAAYGAEHDELNRYPEGDSGALRQVIARTYDLPVDQLVCGAGSDELISLLVRAYAGPGDEVLHSAHGFLMYPLAAKAAGATPVSAPERNLTSDVDALLNLAGPRTRLVFLANPNNPTGSYLPAAELGRLRAGLPEQVLLVIDAAYAEYVEREDYEPGIQLVRAHDNVVMTRTFSKIHGLASLRLGWAFCPRAVADVLNRVRVPFNVCGPAQAAGIAALEDVEHVARSRRHNSRWLAWFSAQAAGLGLVVLPSVGNFVLLRFPSVPGKDAASAADALKQRGILLRAMGAYGLPDCLRVTIGTGEDMKVVVQALGEFLS